ncbi:MAG: GNAT family N-acetyltransferase [Dehalococcoidia bacterium]
MSGPDPGGAELEFGDFRIAPLTIAHGVDDFAWRSDPETSSLDGSGGEPGGLSEFLRRLEEDLTAVFPWRRWFALLSPMGDHFGTIVLSGATPGAGVAEIGITLGRPEFRDRGIGTRAVAGLVRHLWQTTVLRRLELHTYAWNERAHRCFLKAGFRDAGEVLRGEERLLKMEARREWWLLWDGEGRFDSALPTPRVRKEE